MISIATTTALNLRLMEQEVERRSHIDWRRGMVWNPTKSSRYQELAGVRPKSRTQFEQSGFICKSQVMQIGGQTPD